MESSSNFLSDYFTDTYNFAYYKLGNKQQAEDVASQTINLFLLKTDMINPEKRIAWLRTTCLNYCRKYYTRVVRDKRNINHVREELIHFYRDDHQENLELISSFRKAMENLNELEARTLVIYFNSGQNIKKMSEIIGENYSSLRKRIFRIKNKLKAETYKELGYIATRKIIIPQLHEAVIQFIKRLKKNIENNTIEKMFYYFSEIDIKDYKPEFDIQKIRDYEVTLRDGIYTIYLFYQDSAEVMRNLNFSFHLNRKNQLKIIRLPKMARRLLHFENSTKTAQEIIKLLRNSPENGKGLIKINSDTLKQIIAKN